jgi:hypothetical protein
MPVNGIFPGDSVVWIQRSREAIARALPNETPLGVDNRSAGA